MQKGSQITQILNLAWIQIHRSITGNGAADKVARVRIKYVETKALPP